jgi:hypothetical protein
MKAVIKYTGISGTIKPGWYCFEGGFPIHEGLETTCDNILKIWVEIEDFRNVVHAYTVPHSDYKLYIPLIEKQELVVEGCIKKQLASAKAGDAIKHNHTTLRGNVTSYDSKKKRYTVKLTNGILMHFKREEFTLLTKNNKFGMFVINCPYCNRYPV